MGWQCRPPVFSSLPVQRNFDLCRYLGTWYEIKWYRNRPVTDVWGDYAQLWDFKDHSERYLKVDGQARRPNETNCFSFGPWSVDASRGAKMIVKTENNNKGAPVNWPYYVLKTDYYHYALVVYCTSDNYRPNKPCDKQLILIFSRQKTLADKYLKPLIKYVNDYLCVSPGQLQTTIFQKNPCPVL
ncbi:unnamed protein product [Rotaria sordida]|uniref:Lipocalin/cytosolic fatty-acid binding domain-containing protein n=1 Tax=Rotaria sordida TaxID=392033 RepID=A0A819W7P1_9BILA|nr:unnamed protein product [Rotaria sordida]